MIKNILGIFNYGDTLVAMKGNRKTEREFAKEKRTGVMNSRMGDRTQEMRCGNRHHIGD